ncbi:MAG: chromosome partitioning protein [Acidobacteriota bacterium]|jgi:chromosome partitioning protein|nr:chromosome partitioning protein [Acidobacteriota bacterium]
MITIAVANQKGGVGKTTTTRELSACCALRGYQVLAIDCDPQGNLTSSWVDSDVYEATLSHVLIEPDSPTGLKAEPLPLSDAVVESPVENLDIVPADIRLARFEMQPDYLTHRLSNQLREHGQGYDLVFIDCPPQLGKLLTAALYSADYVLVPCAADAMGLQGLSDLAFTIEQVRKNVNANLRMLGAVINLYKPSRNLSAESRQAVEAAVGLVGHVFDTNLHDYSKVAEAPSQKMPAVMYARSHRAADQLWSLTEEVLDRLKMPRQKISAVK